MKLPHVSSSWHLALFALAAGGLAAWAAQGYLREQSAALEARHAVSTVERIVAANDLPDGTALHRGLLAVRAFPATHVPSGSLAPDELAEVDGASLRAPLQAGDPLLAVHLGHVRQPGLGLRLRPGRRALALPVDVGNALPGLIQAGDVVDLYVTFNHRRRRVTAPLVQSITVLAVGRDAGSVIDADTAPEAAGLLTLDTSPAQAMKLIAAREAGRITAMLRAPDDTAASTLAARGDLAMLLGMDVPQPAARPRIIYGNQRVRGLPALGKPPVAGSADGFFQVPSAVAPAAGASSGTTSWGHAHSEARAATHTGDVSAEGRSDDAFADVQGSDALVDAYVDEEADVQGMHDDDQEPG